MCSVDAPEPQVVEVDKPAFVRNPYLDEADADARSAAALRRGRSSLVIPTEAGQVGFTGRGGSAVPSVGGTPNGNSRNPLGGGGPSGGGSSGGPVNPNLGIPSGGGGGGGGNHTRRHRR